MTIRRFDFVTGLESSTPPDYEDPVNPGDALSLGFADGRYVQGGPPAADIAALKAIVVADRQDKDLILVESQNALYRYDIDGTGTNDDNFIVTPTAGAGRWFRVTDFDSSGNLVVPGDLTVNGTLTSISTTNTEIEDANIVLNKGGDEASADSNVSGFTVEMSDATDAVLGFDSTLASRFKAGDTGGLEEILTTGHVQEIDGQKSFVDVPVLFEELGSTPSTPASGFRGLYATGSGFSQIDDAGVVSDLGGGGGATELVYATSSDYTVLDNDDYTTILVTTSGTDKTITLPTASANTNRLIKIKKVDSGVGMVIVDGESAETIDGVATKILRTQYESIIIQCNGTAWFVVGSQYFPIYLSEQTTAALTNNTLTNIGSGTVYVPAGTYVCRWGGTSSISLSSGAGLTFIATSIRVVDSGTNTSVASMDNRGSAVANSASGLLLTHNTMKVITLASAQTLKLYGSINVNGGTVTDRTLFECHLEMTRLG